jgi:hypothetical protein
MAPEPPTQMPGLSQQPDTAQAVGNDPQLPLRYNPQEYSTGSPQQERQHGTTPQPQPGIVTPGGMVSALPYYGLRGQTWAPVHWVGAPTLAVVYPLGTNYQSLPQGNPNAANPAYGTYGQPPYPAVYGQPWTGTPYHGPYHERQRSEQYQQAFPPFPLPGMEYYHYQYDHPVSPTCGQPTQFSAAHRTPGPSSSSIVPQSAAGSWRESSGAYGMAPVLREASGKLLYLRTTQ